MKKISIVILFFFASICEINAQAPNYLKDYKDVYIVDPRKANLQWFKDARFGMFIHFGIYSQVGNGSWIQMINTIPLNEYAQLKETFNPTKFDAGFIAKLAVKAGMKYITITTKHHDGFCLFQTKQTDFNSINSPVKRDLIGEIAEACEREGLGLFLYYSYGADWKHPYFYDRNIWEYARPAYPEKPKEYKYRKPSDFKKYITFVHKQIKELLTQYPYTAGIWFDPIKGVYAAPELFPIDETYNLIREISPHALISFKQGANGNEDFMAPEGKKSAQIEGDYKVTQDQVYSKNSVKPIEVCVTMQNRIKGTRYGGFSWAYNKSLDGHHKTVDEVKQLLDEAQSGNYNLLLNIGPLPDGSVHSEDVKTLSNIR
jgi:alpha-L-fucosidase